MEAKPSEKINLLLRPPYQMKTAISHFAATKKNDSRKKILLQTKRDLSWRFFFDGGFPFLSRHPPISRVNSNYRSPSFDAARAKCDTSQQFCK